MLLRPSSRSETAEWKNILASVIVEAQKSARDVTVDDAPPSIPESPSQSCCSTGDFVSVMMLAVLTALVSWISFLETAENIANGGCSAVHLSRDALSAINSTAEAVSSLESIRNCTSGSFWLAALEPPLAEDYQSREVQFYLDARACMSRAAERLCAAGSDAAQVGVSMTAFAEDVSSRGIELHTAIVSRVPGKAAKVGKHDDAGFSALPGFHLKARKRHLKRRGNQCQRCGKM